MQPFSPSALILALSFLREEPQRGAPGKTGASVQGPPGKPGTNGTNGTNGVGSIPLSCVWAISQISTNQVHAQQNGFLTIAQQGATTAHRIRLPAGTTWRIMATITDAVPAGETLRAQVFSSATLAGVYAEEAVATINFQNGAGADAQGTGVEFAVGASDRFFCLASIFTRAMAYPGQLAIHLERVS